METIQPKSICECGRQFDKPVGLSIHQRTCKTKAAERERDVQYGRELAEREKEKHDAAVAAMMQPRRARAWEDPKLRGKPPAKPLAATPGSAAPASGTSQAETNLPGFRETEPQTTATHGIDNIRTECHPSSGRGVTIETFENYREHTFKPISIPEITEPWRPFQSRTDFEFAQLALDASLTKAHVDKFIQLVERCINGQDSFNIANHQDLYKTWDAASTMLTPNNQSQN